MWFLLCSRLWKLRFRLENTWKEECRLNYTGERTCLPFPIKPKPQNSKKQTKKPSAIRLVSFCGLEYINQLHFINFIDLLLIFGLTLYKKNMDSTLMVN
jgi:hypothetical protein